MKNDFVYKFKKYNTQIMWKYKFIFDKYPACLRLLPLQQSYFLRFILNSEQIFLEDGWT